MFGDRYTFKSDLSYSVQNEDYQTELAIIERLGKASQRILLIASSGENALSILSQNTLSELHALDLNAAQIHLCALRAAATQHLNRDEQLRLLGAAPSVNRAEDISTRLSLYDQLRSELPETTRAHWDERRNTEVAFGLHHVGRNDGGMRDLQQRLAEAGFDPLITALDDHDLERWQQVYIELWTPDYIRELFGLASQELATKISGIAAYLGECHFRALQQPHADKNPFLTTVFANRYPYLPDEKGLPLYLQSAAYATLQTVDLSTTLHLHQGNALQQMQPLVEAHGLFDLISISNIADWMSKEQFTAAVSNACDCLKPGGALLARTATPRRMIIEVMSRHMDVDEAFNQQLAAVERGPWFRIIACGFNKKS